MTKDQQIRKALALLAPPSRQHAECQRDIDVALDRVERWTAVARSFRVAGSKEGKVGVKRYCACGEAAGRTLNPLSHAWTATGHQTVPVPVLKLIYPRGHHRELHRCGDEAEWWKKVGIDPMVCARTLWLASHPHPVTAKMEGASV